MNNQEIKPKIDRVLIELQELVNQGLVSKEQILDIFEKERRAEPIQRTQAPRLSFQRLLYLVGGFIIVLGVGIFVRQFWYFWSQPTKVIFALGLSSFLYALGYYFHHRHSKFLIFSNVLFILSALLLPLGLGTFFDLINISAATSGGLTINFALLFIVYFSSYWVLKNDIFLLFAIAAGSGFFISFTDFLVKNPSAIFYEYRLPVLGATYFALGYYLKSYRQYIANILYFFGLIMFLGAAFALSLDSTLWLFVFPFILAGTFYASVPLQSKLILSLVTIFTFIEIGRLTTKYFSGSLGWPITLIIAGFGIIFIGYFSFEVSKRYVSSKSANE